MNNDIPSTETNAAEKPACACKAYPFLLIASTTIAAVFCFMYVTKPTGPPAIQAPVPAIISAPPKSEPATKAAPPEAKLLPDTSKLPGNEATPAAETRNIEPNQIPSEPNPAQP
ncbi:MAG: hypothetical protein ACK49N_01310 [Verrucomicrobiota bacterium]